MTVTFNADKSFEPKSFLSEGAGKFFQFPGSLFSEINLMLLFGISIVTQLKAPGISSILTFTEYSNKASALLSDVYMHGIPL